jgi:transcriptional regulator with PAS, ATPase and Fis domain
VLEDQVIRRVGGVRDMQVDVRVIAASNRDLEKAVRESQFRQDLYYRLAIIAIFIPPLRDRKEDILPLVDFFIDRYNRQFKKSIRGISDDTRKLLLNHTWPGNVRELKNTVEGMVVFAEGRRALDLSDLPEALRETSSPGERLSIAVGMTVDETERQLIAATLRHTGGDKPRTAAMLGIGLRTLYRKIKQYGLG